jgi:hypothetical protein
LIARHKDGPSGFATSPLKEQRMFAQVFFECSAVRRNVFVIAWTVLFLHTIHGRG